MAKKTNEAKKSSFFRECVGELKKVTWPTKDDVWASVKVVIALSILMALLLGGLDLGFGSLFEFLLTK
ncbi:preprotein translocase subunit SecE [Treponema sp.]|uniref:preprotein translocase subunit SecE n=1 Tax=Treponema sp. TaxID=166 RepID=UPI00298D67C5|nr:preprotein translocase subunit SecE [Treponema sp.]